MQAFHHVLCEKRIVSESNISRTATVVLRPARTDSGTSSPQGCRTRLRVQASPALIPAVCPFMCSGRHPWRGHRQDAAFRNKIDDTKEKINAIMAKMLDLQKKNEECPSPKTGASTTGKGQTESADYQQSGRISEHGVMATAYYAESMHYMTLSI